MATVTYYIGSNSSSSPATVTGVSWNAGDIIVTMAGNEVADGTALPSSLPTNANLTFENLQTVNTGSGCDARTDYAVAGSSQTSQTISQAHDFEGIVACWVISPAAGEVLRIRDTASNESTTAGGTTLNVADNSVVLYGMFDWNAYSGTKAGMTTSSGTATERTDSYSASHYGWLTGDWAGTTAGSTAFGLTSYSSLDPSNLLVEVGVLNEIATDDFNRADGGVGANYSTPTGTTEVQVVSNTAQGPTDATTYVSSWSADTFDNDQWAEADVTLGGTSSEGAVYVRLATGGAFTGYGFIWDTAASGTYRIVEVTAGSEANIGSTSTGVGTTGTKTLRLEVVGTALTAYVDGVEVLTTTDATITAGEPGIGMYRSSGATATLDDFSAGDWTTPSTDATATPSVVAATASVPAPTVTAAANASITPSTVAAISAVQTVTVTASSGITTTPATIVAVGSVDSPTITAEANALATANVVAGLVAIPPPTVDAGGVSNVPQNLVATTFSSSRIDLTWDAVAGATGYDVRYEAGAMIVEDHGTTSYSDTGLDPSTLYSYEVRAVFS